jgi:hypothetical protein
MSNKRNVKFMNDIKKIEQTVMCCDRKSIIRDIVEKRLGKKYDRIMKGGKFYTVLKKQVRKQDIERMIKELVEVDKVVL